jgi:hypothetical protein
MYFDPSLPTSYEYIHYTGENIAALDLSRTYTQTVEKLALHTPNGLWLSITGINDWEKYCLKNYHNLTNLKYEFQVKLKPRANILILHNNAAFEDFEKKYGYYGKNHILGLSIRWDEIIKNYQGLALPVILPPLDNRSPWHDTWNCTSACIWDLQAVEKVDRLG